MEEITYKTKGGSISADYLKGTFCHGFPWQKSMTKLQIGKLETMTRLEIMTKQKSMTKL